MSKHTPGPWERAGSIVVNPAISRKADKPRTIAECPRWNENREADARLIAAAPDLLEALKAIIDSPACEMPSPIYIAARVAIAKAQGT